MRGEQIAAHCGWVSATVPTDEQLNNANIIVIVKRFTSDLIKRIPKKKIIVYDILDFWNQKVAPPRDLGEAFSLANARIDIIKPRAIIAANKLMANDLRFSAKKVTSIYHHYRLNARPLNRGNVIYYDGDIKHLGQWEENAKKVFSKHGYEFKVGVPEDGAAAYFSARDSWLSIRWKSNVKAANAIGFAIPLLTRPEQGAVETHPNALYYNNLHDLEVAVEELKQTKSPGLREQFSIDAIAYQYKNFFNSL